MAAGFFAGRFSKRPMPLVTLNTMLVEYALPFSLFIYTARMNPQTLSQNGAVVAVLCMVMLLPYLVSLGLSRWVFPANLGSAAVKAVTIGMPNFASVGLPLLHALYGRDADITVAVAVTTASVVMSPAGMILLERCQPVPEGSRGLLGKALRNAFLKPVVIAPLAGTALSISGIALPDLVAQSLGVVGNTTAGLALFSTGLVLAAQPFRLEAEVWVGAFLSNALQPMLAWGMTWLLGLPTGLASQVILLSAIPCGAFGILFGLSYGVTDRAAGTTLVVSSVLSGVTLTLTILLLH